jgi:hypothetical protein
MEEVKNKTQTLFLFEGTSQHLNCIVRTLVTKETPHGGNYSA